MRDSPIEAFYEALILAFLASKAWVSTREREREREQIHVQSIDW